MDFFKSQRRGIVSGGLGRSIAGAPVRARCTLSCLLLGASTAALLCCSRCQAERMRLVCLLAVCQQAVAQGENGGRAFPPDVVRRPHHARTPIPACSAGL